jgi:hypothetical protein
LAATNGALNLGNWTGLNVLNGALKWSGGAMTGTLQMPSNSVINWTGGNLGGSTLIDAGAQFTVLGGSTH